MGIALEIDELLNEAIITETPLILVEGIDDIGVYESILLGANVNAEVYASENIESEGDGCDGVIKSIAILENEFPDFPLSPHVLGIIDRDVRHFRNEMPTSDLIYVLNAYSFESHFVTKEATKAVVKRITRTTEALISNNCCDDLYSDIQLKLHDLYYTSLEALKNACDPTYESSFGYSNSIQEIKHRKLNEFADDKITTLDDFAQQNNISNTWDDILSICKGKWLLHEFTVLLKSEISTLSNKCAQKEIQQCQYCATGKPEKCLYKPLPSYTSNIIQDIITSDHKYGEFEYIHEKIEQTFGASQHCA